MDQVLPGYAEECRLLHSDHGHSMIGYPIEQISPNYEMNHHYGAMKHEHLPFPGDHDNVSLYFGGNHKEFRGIEEGERRKLRRERNKVAASKCRNKRKEHVRYLTKESDDLENKNNDLQDEISLLQAEIKELETMLDSHRCNMKSEGTTP